MLAWPWNPTSPSVQSNTIINHKQSNISADEWTKLVHQPATHIHTAPINPHYTVRHKKHTSSCFWLSSCRASSTRPLISGGQGWRHVLVPVDSTLNNWLIEIIVCLLNGFVFTRTLFLVRTSNLKANIYTVPVQFVKNSYFKFLQGSVATLFRWSWKILSYFVANLSETLHINFYQNQSSIVEVMIKKFWCVFYASQCICCENSRWVALSWCTSLPCIHCTNYTALCAVQTPVYVQINTKTGTATLTLLVEQQ